VLGYIVDGGCRDWAFMEELGFPVFCEYFTPVDVVGKWAATALGESIQIGEVTVRTGDYVLADRDGIVVIPAEFQPTSLPKWCSRPRKSYALKIWFVKQFCRGLTPSRRTCSTGNSDATGRKVTEAVAHPSR
jgi:hypothetical protein